MKMSRRQVLAGCAALVFARPVLAQDGAIVLTARRVTRQLFEKGNPASAVWSLAGVDGVPVIRVKQGVAATLRFVNELDEDLWLHLFGVRGAADAMSVQVPKGPQPVDVTFRPPDAGTFWIGPLLNASKQRDMGIAAMLIVEEAAGLAGFADHALILDDWMLEEDGSVTQNFGDLNAAIAEGRMGNWFTVNNAFKPRIALDRAKNNRLRILNVANTRTFNLLFKNCTLNLLALDGQPVMMRPLGSGPLSLAPGQRADLLVVEAADQAIMEMSLFEDVVEAAFFLSVGKAGDGVADNFALPPNPVSQPADGVEPRTVTLTLQGGAKGGLKAAKVDGVETDLRKMLERGLAWAINDQAGPGGPPLFEAKLGEVLMLDIDNQTAFEQALHIHGHVWRMVEVDGVAEERMAFRDTAVIPGQKRAKLLLVADNPGLWGLNSLMTERCDAGLIGSFAVSA